MAMSREKALTEAFVEAADTLVDDFDVIDFLHTLAERCVQLLDVDAAGLMLADHHGSLHASAASSENARLMELFELQTDAGPCVDCYRGAVAVVNADLDANAERWPRFAEAASALGFVSVHALPLRLRERVIGALNLFCSGPEPLGEDDVRVGQSLADVATIGILAQRSLEQADLVTTQLQTALNSRISIEQAKGVLAERHQIKLDEAFTALRRHARDNNLRMSDLARDVANGSLLPIGDETAAARVVDSPENSL
jgi:transcriptional regulator with GAF, ATPase, and Fis domain